MEWIVTAIFLFLLVWHKMIEAKRMSRILKVVSEYDKLNFNDRVTLISKIKKEQG